MPISQEEFERGERVATPSKDTSKGAKTAPTTGVTKKTVQHKGQIKAYGRYNSMKFFVKFDPKDGEDDKAMFQESHWHKFQSGDVIEFESKYNGESQWHRIHKRHYVGLVEKVGDTEVEIEIETSIGYVTKWKEEDESGLLECKTYLPEFVDGVKQVVFTEGTIFTDTDFEYARCKVYGVREGTKLLADTVEVVDKKYLQQNLQVGLGRLTYYDGYFSFVQHEMKGSMEAEWSTVELNKEKAGFFGSIHIYGEFRMHGRWIKNEMTGDWEEKLWYELVPKRSRFEISEEFTDYFEEVVLGSKVVEFFKGIRETLEEELLSTDEIIALAASEGLEISAENVRERLWKAEYNVRYWDFLLKKLMGGPEGTKVDFGDIHSHVYYAHGMYVFEID